MKITTTFFLLLVNLSLNARLGLCQYIRKMSIYYFYFQGVFGFIVQSLEVSIALDCLSTTKNRNGLSCNVIRHLSS
jgi:hypothetical protein